VAATEERMGATLNELSYRLSPRHLNQKVKNRISEKPYKAGLIAMGAGVVSGILVSKKLKRG
ncbi:MAG TPA: hypothetical protein VLT36_08485, partial [Candidatus Dormibacteraeota bacterium]|nr:hypothetical protein [Candidatus Dormibacteraeota bacterium]